MAFRYVKIALLLCIAMLCVFYASQNLANLGAAYQAVAYVTSNAGHAIYPASFGPALGHPALVWIALGLVITGEMAAGLCTAKGARDLWSARKSPATGFNAAKTWGLVGCGLGMLVWLGLFSVVGGAYFQMWQTTAGANSQNGAFQFLSMCAFVLLIVATDDRGIDTR